MDPEKAKTDRKNARTIFTRKRNELLRSVRDRRIADVIEDDYAELVKAWKELEGKHNAYIELLKDDEMNTAENWLEELQNLYTDARNLKFEYIENETRARAEKERDESASKEKECILNKRNTARAVFDALYGNASHTMENEKVTTTHMKSLQSQLEEAFVDCKQKHEKLIELIDKDSAERELRWIFDVQQRYSEISELMETRVDENESKTFIKSNDGATLKLTTDAMKPSNIHLEKIKMPRFDGELRDYPQFKRDFEKQVMPNLNINTAPYTLRSCLGMEPLAHVKSVDDDIQAMWERLDSKYGDPAKVADAIINSIQNVKCIKEGEHKKFIQFVNVIEEGYRDLCNLKLEKEITTTSSISIIEKRLPPDVMKEWARLVSNDTSTIDKTDKFPSLLRFLLNLKRALEYQNAELRLSSEKIKGSVNHTDKKDDNPVEQQRNTKQNRQCLIHENGNHWTSECRVYLSKPIEEKEKIVKEKGACWSCLRRGHRSQQCRSKRICNVNNCKRTHHSTLHQEKKEEPSPKQEETPPSVSGTASVCDSTDVDTCLLQIQKIRSPKGWVNVLWDNGASLSFITNAKAEAEKLRGTKVQLSLVKVGGENEALISYKYKLPLFDLQGNRIYFDVYGIDKITSDIQNVKIDGIAKHFNNIPKEDLVRPTGTVDVLIGYEYANYHPQKEKNVDHLLLLKNRFGRCLGGTHSSIKNMNEEQPLRNIRAHHVRAVRIEDFYNIENLGINCNPRCGGCKCGKCSVGSKNYSIKEEKELALIDKNLKYDEENKVWIAGYPWIRDPYELPDNKRVAFSMLMSTERRLMKNKAHADVYQKQIEDMIARGVARKLSQDELQSYKGPIHYISHHEVLKPDSKSTPVRIVFNSSANYMGHVLNEYWAKGPDLLNELLGILIRFRENEIAIIGDVKKMYHTVRTQEIDHHTHRFLWRDFNTSQHPNTYIIQRVSFGDRPSGTIATLALRKTAERLKQQYPEAANVIINNTYMDDLIESVPTLKDAKKLASDMEKVLITGGFQIKEWMYSYNASHVQSILPVTPNTATEKVLGVEWNTNQDELCFKVKLNLQGKMKKKNPKPIACDALTKRKILSQVNSIYDPLGLAGPVTVKAKILMRQLWISDLTLDWDDPIPSDHTKDWMIFFDDLPGMNEVKIRRCMKAPNTVGNPILIIFSDGSTNAYGACAYARWKLTTGEFDSHLIISKNRLTPVKKISIDRIELCGAVLSSRLKTTITSHCRYKFERIIYIVDSQIVHAMIQKENYGYNTFAAVRVGEIQENTDPENWYWTESKNNIADWLTRGKKSNEIGMYTLWQKGPDFLKLPESAWPITRTYTQQHANVITHTKPDEAVNDSLAKRINIDRFSTYNKLIHTTARILAMYNKTHKMTFKNASRPLTPDDISKAETFWIHEAQKSMQRDIDKGKYKRLCPRRRDDGIYVVGGRGERWIEMSYNKTEVILLPYQHRLSRLYAEHIHRRGHLGFLATASKVRSRFWITKLLTLTKSIKYNCIICRKLERKPEEQIMGKLPIERLKPAPPWNSTAIDYFGPFKIKDEVKKRTFGKGYGVLFNCMGTRAVHIDIAPDYSTDKFLMVLRRFVSIRGYPSKLYSDNGSQLVAASAELKKVINDLDKKQLLEFGVMEGFEWKFSSADAPWQNGVSEALIKSVKKAITLAIGESVLTFSELQTICYEAANLVNERPIGRHPTSTDDTYLCPNDLLLGRATSRVPSGPFKEPSNIKQRFELVQQLTDSFWRKWTRDYFPSLLVQQKWHTAQRNLEIDDIVLIQDSNAKRGQWKLGKISKVYKGEDGKVRRALVEYKNPKPGEKVTEYKGKGFTTIERPVNKLITILPASEDK